MRFPSEWIIRFDELMYQAGITAQGCWDEMDGYDQDAILNFAELIVRECAAMAESFHHHQYDFTGNLELHEFIKEHFGLEP